MTESLTFQLNYCKRHEKVTSNTVLPPKAVWVVIVFSSLTVASFFLATSIVDFVNRSVVTTIGSTTASLQVLQALPLTVT